MEVGYSHVFFFCFPLAPEANIWICSCWGSPASCFNCVCRLFGRTRRIYREIFFAVLSETMLMRVNLNSKVKGCKTETKMLEDTKTLRKAEGGNLRIRLDNPKKTKNKNRVVIEQHTTRCAACPLRRHRGGNRSISRQTVYTCKIMCIMRAALSRQSAALILWSRTNCPWHIRVGVERYQSHFIEMKELAQTAIWDISHSFFSVTETRSQFTSQVLPVISASLVPPHHKFLFMLTHPTGRPILWPALSQNTPHVGILDVVQAAISSLCAAYTISYTVKEHWI